MFYVEVGVFVVCVWDIFVNVDGNGGCIVCFFFYVFFNNVRIIKVDVEVID